MEPTNHPFRKEHDLPGCRLVPEKKVPASTPLKTNMSPENQWLEDVFPTKIVPFLGFMLVFRGVILGMWFTIPESPFHDCPDDLRTAGNEPILGVVSDVLSQGMSYLNL